MAAETSKLQPSLLRLPREIRDQIYHYIVNHDYLPIRIAPDHARQAGCYFCLHFRFGYPRPWPFRLLDFILVCRQIYAEVTPLFYSTNTFVLDASLVVRFLTFLTPTTRCLIQSCMIGFYGAATGWSGIPQCLQRHTNTKRVLLVNKHCNHTDVDIWKVAVQEFLCMPKLTSLVLCETRNPRFRKDPETRDARFREELVAMVKPHRVRAWEPVRGTEASHTRGFEIVRAE